MSAEHITYIQTYMPSFALAYMRVEYQSDAVDLALARYNDCFIWADYFEGNNVPFNHAIMMYALTFTSPYIEELRQTAGGFISPEIWIVDNHYRFKASLDLYDDGWIPPLPVIGNTEKHYKTYTAIADGQQSIALDNEPVYYQLYINGLRQDTVSCTIAGSSLTVPGDYSIIVGDFILVDYDVLIT